MSIFWYIFDSSDEDRMDDDMDDLLEGMENTSVYMKAVQRNDT